MKLFLTLVYLIFVSAQIFAGPLQKVTYNGQNGDSVELDLIDTVVRYREEMRDSTCTRKVPYQVEECGDETRYRRECSWMPGRNDCRTEYERICRNVTRYREECTTKPGRRVCRQKPPRQICRNGVCRTEPSRRICETKPGRRVCRQVPYTDRVCNRRPRQVCTWIPGRDVCRDVPYTEYVCRDVTRYRNESFPCKRPVKIPYNVDRKVKANVEVNYFSEVDSGPVDFTFNLNEAGNIKVAATDRSDTPVLISMKKEIQRDVEEDETNTEANFSFTFLNKEKELAPVKKTIKSAGLTKTSAFFTIGKVTVPERLKVTLTLTRKTILGNTRTPFNQTLTTEDLTLRELENGTKVIVNLGKFGVKLKNKKYNLKVKVDLNLESSIINQVRESLSKTQNFSIKAH